MAKINLNFYNNQDVYSDGDIEDILLELVKDHTDYTEILHSTNIWPVMYHLTPVRENILHWYDFDESSNLLEIGGGCGALTGLFARRLRGVKVVELSKRRAEIIYNRHIKCSNLEVIAGNLNDINFSEKFDYITLIGVLEYAGKFTQEEQPFKRFLEKVKSFLKPEGKLLIAIENKFGLKYWAGAKEDHTGKFFDGIENYPEDKSIQTFGKIELEKLLKSAGYNKFSFYYPMPDYKLPKIIYSDSYLPDIGEWIDTYSPNFDQNRLALFNERNAYKSIINNSQFPFFANSFLVEVML